VNAEHAGQIDPLAYHITLGAYGTRLFSRDERIVSVTPNTPDDPIIGLEQDWHGVDRDELQCDPVRFNIELRKRIENELIPAVCQREGWILHTCASASNHIHVLLSAVNDPDGITVRKWFKRRLTAAINQVHPIPVGETARWWAKGGSVKSVWSRDYFDRVFACIEAQRLPS
jgi:REP element-mobilizing transposase RayT